MAGLLGIHDRLAPDRRRLVILTSTLRTVRRRVVVVTLGSSRVSVTEPRLTETLPSSRLRVALSAGEPPVCDAAPDWARSEPPRPRDDCVTEEPEVLSDPVPEPGMIGPMRPC